MAIITGDIAGMEICKALGISSENVCRVTIDIQCGHVATITVIEYLTKENGERLAETIATVYKLEPIDGR